MSEKHILDHLHKYMFLQNVCLDRVSKPTNTDFFVKETTSPILSSNKIFVPGEKDKLFWCFFIMRNGLDKYLSIGQNHFQVETSTKFGIAESLKDNEILLKQNKLKRDVIENELVNEKIITMEGLKALCVLHNVNVLVILKNMFYKISGLSDSETLVIEQDKNGEFGIVDSICEERKQNYCHKDSSLVLKRNFLEYLVKCLGWEAVLKTLEQKFQVLQIYLNIAKLM